jgi:hypothetical protein
MMRVVARRFSVRDDRPALDEGGTGAQFIHERREDLTVARALGRSV